MFEAGDSQRDVQAQLCELKLLWREMICLTAFNQRDFITGDYSGGTRQLFVHISCAKTSINDSCFHEELLMMLLITSSPASLSKITGAHREVFHPPIGCMADLCRVEWRVRLVFILVLRSGNWTSDCANNCTTVSVATLALTCVELTWTFLLWGDNTNYCTTVPS